MRLHGITDGEPIGRVWCWHFTAGAVGWAATSIPSIGAAVILGPLFAVAAVTTAAGTVRRRRHVASIGLLVLSVASWARSFALWGVDQQGAGSKVIASFSWAWIAGTAALMALAVGRRGLR